MINHSRKNPNCLPFVIEFQENPKVMFKAKKDIHPGDEVTYDYGDRRQQSIIDYPWLKN